MEDDVAQWKDMETAPFDKTEVLLTNGSIVTPARYLSEGWMAPGYNGSNMQFHPTGWMPFPKATVNE